MTKRYGIGILLCTAILCVLYCTSYRYSADEARIQIEEHAEDFRTAEASGGREKKLFKYFLKEKNGCVYVYLTRTGTLYETTSIRVSQLPKSLQQELEVGKYLLDEHELYDFLENYSS